MSTLIVIGGTSGLGAQVIKQSAGFDNRIAVGLGGPTDPPVVRSVPSDITTLHMDVREEVHFQWLEDQVRETEKRSGTFGEGNMVLVNCAGINRIDYLENVQTSDWDELMDVNARSMMLTAQQFLPQLAHRRGTICNIISNASHMPMTSSLVYNATKGAAHIMTLQMARELTKLHGITVFGVSPAKIAGTGMSKYIDERVPELRGWTPEQARDYQLAGLLVGEEINPAVLGEFIAWILAKKERHFHLSGCVLPYGA